MLSEIRAYLPVSDFLATSGQPTEAQFAEIAESGFQVVINLVPDNHSSLPDEDVIVPALGMEYVNIPVEWTAPQIADLDQFFATMDTHQHRRVWVHCAANMRVSAFLYLWRTSHRGEPEAPARAAMEHIWYPNTVWAQFLRDAATPS